MSLILLVFQNVFSNCRIEEFHLVINILVPPCGYNLTQQEAEKPRLLYWSVVVLYDI